VVSTFCERLERVRVYWCCEGTSIPATFSPLTFLPPQYQNTKSSISVLTGEKQHALSTAIFANYLLLDTLLSAIPRFLLVSILSPLSSTLCTPDSKITSFHRTPLQLPTSRITSLDLPSSSTSGTPGSNWENLSAGWTPDGCYRIVYLAQITLGASVIAATVLQFVGALNVREYAKALWMREITEEEQIVAFLERGEMARMEDEWGFGGLSPIREEEEFDVGMKKV
jgi:hypothetical protein